MLNLNSNKLLYQDFLFRNLPIKNGDIDYEIEYSDYKEEVSDIFTPRNIFDIDIVIREISLEYLMSILTVELWDALCSFLRFIDELFIVDDIDLENNELQKYKEMFLKAYQFNLRLICVNTFVQRRLN